MLSSDATDVPTLNSRSRTIALAFLACVIVSGPCALAQETTLPQAAVRERAAIATQESAMPASTQSIADSILTSVTLSLMKNVTEKDTWIWLCKKPFDSRCRAAARVVDDDDRYFAELVFWPAGKSSALEVTVPFNGSPVKKVFVYDGDKELARLQNLKCESRNCTGTVVSPLLESLTTIRSFTVAYTLSPSKGVEFEVSTLGLRAESIPLPDVAWIANCKIYLDASKSGPELVAVALAPGAAEPMFMIASGANVDVGDKRNFILPQRRQVEGQVVAKFVNFGEAKSYVEYNRVEKCK